MTVKSILPILYAVLVGTVAPLCQATDVAPDFTLKSTQGSNLRLSEHRGEVVLLNFWASYCGPCRQEMPQLDALQKRYSKLGFTVIGVNVEGNSDLANKVLKDIPVTFPILLDDANHTVSASYKQQAMPMTVLIDRDGNMRYLHNGYKPGYEQDYEQQIKELIRE